MGTNQRNNNIGALFILFFLLSHRRLVPLVFVRVLTLARRRQKNQVMFDQTVFQQVKFDWFLNHFINTMGDEIFYLFW